VVKTLPGIFRGCDQAVDPWRKYGLTHSVIIRIHSLENFRDMT